MTDRTDEPPPNEGEGDGTPAAYSRREWLGMVIMLWLAGSLSDIQTIRLLYGLQGYGWFGYGGGPPATE